MLRKYQENPQDAVENRKKSAMGLLLGFFRKNSWKARPGAIVLVR